jgi:hypothetical protein
MLAENGSCKSFQLVYKACWQCLESEPYFFPSAFPSLGFNRFASSLLWLMLWFQIFQDGPEYEARKNRGTFIPPNLSLKQLHDAVPRHLHQKSTLKSLTYILRHIAFTWGFYYLGTIINISTSHYFGGNAFATILVKYFVRPSLWILYWGWQGITFAGIWCLGEIK